MSSILRSLELPVSDFLELLIFSDWVSGASCLQRWGLWSLVSDVLDLLVSFWVRGPAVSHYLAFYSFWVWGILCLFLHCLGVGVLVF